jgi:hypothetical protein
MIDFPQFVDSVFQQKIDDVVLGFVNRGVAGVASDALTAIRRNGWFQHQSSGGRHCMLTALGAVAVSTVRQDTIRALANVIKAEYPDRADGWYSKRARSTWGPEFRDMYDQCTVIDFNDDENTTMADVERVFEKVAAQ